MLIRPGSSSVTVKFYRSMPKHVCCRHCLRAALTVKTLLAKAAMFNVRHKKQCRMCVSTEQIYYSTFFCEEWFSLTANKCCSSSTVWKLFHCVSQKPPFPFDCWFIEFTFPPWILMLIWPAFKALSSIFKHQYKLHNRWQIVPRFPHFFWQIH